MQKELYLRLLKDGEINGYIWIIPYEKAKQYFTAADEYLYPETEYGDVLISMFAENKDNKTWMPVGTINILKPESFELGIKLNDDWDFIGDIFQEKNGSLWELVYMNSLEMIMFIKINKDTNNDNDIRQLHYKPLREILKKIGNIHDNKEFKDAVK